MLIWTKYQLLNASTVGGIYDWMICVYVLCLLIYLIVLLSAQGVRPHHANRARACEGHHALARVPALPNALVLGKEAGNMIG